MVRYRFRRPGRRHIVRIGNRGPRIVLERLILKFSQFRIGHSTLPRILFFLFAVILFDLIR